MIVIDASAFLEVLLNRAASGRIAEILFERSRSLHAPHLIDLEISQVIRRQTRLGLMRPDRALIAVNDLANFPIARYPYNHLFERIWELRENFTAYDAAYVALSEALDAPLNTRDAKIAMASGHRARIELI